MTRTRVISALIMAPLAIAAILFLPTSWMALITAALFLAGMWEWFKLSEIQSTAQKLTLIILNLALMVLIVWASKGTTALFAALAIIGIIWWLLAILWLKFPTFASDHGTHARVFKLGAATLVFIPAWASLVYLHSQADNGPRWLLTALTIVWAADSGAYFAGRAFGKHKLAPVISPNKTIEGLIGGIIAGVLAGLAFGWFAGISVQQMPWLALTALVTVLFSVVGDLLESLLKRHVGAKDSGNLIPGHGGILDRIDAVLAALPVFLVGKEVFGF